MVGLMQIMIYLLCVYLVYKGFEIFQIAFVADDSKSRTGGIVIGVLAIVAAVVIGLGAVVMTEAMVASIGKNMDNIPSMR